LSAIGTLNIFVFQLHKIIDEIQEFSRYLPSNALQF